jgi:hypothetical protein
VNGLVPYLGVGPTVIEAEPPVKTDDSLRSDPGDRFDLVLTMRQTAWRVVGGGRNVDRGS